MVGTPPRCPDCSVEMEQMTVKSGGYNLRFVSEENADGVLGSLGAKEKFGADAFVCSECGLSRVYADVDD